MDYTYARNFIDGRYDIDTDYLIEQSKQQIGGNRILCLSDICIVKYDRELTQGEKDTLDSIVATSRTRIEDLKDAKISQVLNKTVEEESKGVPYSNYRFSITPSAKTNWLSLVVGRDMISYPYDAPTGFERIYSFQNANDVLGFYGAAMGYIGYWEKSNEDLVMAIKACTTKEQLDAIVDDRAYPV